MQADIMARSHNGFYISYFIDICINKYQILIIAMDGLFLPKYVLYNQQIEYPKKQI